MASRSVALYNILNKACASVDWYNLLLGLLSLLYAAVTGVNGTVGSLVNSDGLRRARLCDVPQTVIT